MPRKSFVSLLLIGCCMITSAQNERVIDSLLVQLEEEIPDTTRFKILNELSFQYCFSDPSEAFRYVQTTLQLSKELNNRRFEGRAYFNQGVAYSIIGKLDSSEIAMKESLSRSMAINDSINASRALNGLGNIFRAQSNLPVALDYFIQSLKIKESLPQTNINQREVAGGYIGVGIVYANLEEFDLASDYLEKALSSFEELEYQGGIARAATNLGYVYNASKQHKKALEILSKALEAEKKGGNKDGMSKVFINIGKTYLEIGSQDSAYVNFQQSIKLINELGVAQESAEPLLGLARLSLEKRQLDEALSLAKKGKDLAKTIKSKRLQSDAYKLLAEIYEEQNDFKQAYQNFQTHILLKDSLLNEDNQKKIIQLKTQYEYEKREKELKLARAEKELELEKRNQRNMIASVGGGATILLVTLFVYIQYRQRNKYAKTVEEKNQLLSETMASKEKLFSVIAHDLKSPLSAFSSMSSTLAENIDAFQKEQIVTYLKKFEKSSQNLTELLNNLLQWSLSQTGSLSVNPEIIDIKQAMENAVKPLRDLADSKGVKLSIESKKLQATADGKMVETVIRNLVSNALKFTETGGEVNISSRQEDKQVFISVKDSGIGMDMEEASRLFDVKYDPSKIGDHEGKGTGLGLILSRELIEKNQGTIGVESEKDKGSLFYFTLPSAA